MTGPGGYVMVLFGEPAEDWCTLPRCPLGTAQWFPDRAAAAEYARSVPTAFEPHLVAVVAGAALDLTAEPVKIDSQGPPPSAPALGESGAGAPA